jgi:hypothetical protein
MSKVGPGTAYAVPGMAERADKAHGAPVTRCATHCRAKGHLHRP